MNKSPLEVYFLGNDYNSAKYSIYCMLFSLLHE